MVTPSSIAVLLESVVERIARYWIRLSPFSTRPDMLAGDDVLATALLDRLLDHCHVVNIDGRSYRLRHMAQSFTRAE